jgi:hypothetical protein
MAEDTKLVKVYIPDDAATFHRLKDCSIDEEAAAEMLGNTYDAVPDADMPRWKYFIVTGNELHATFPSNPLDSSFDGQYLYGWWIHNGIAVEDAFKLALIKHKEGK